MKIQKTFILSAVALLLSTHVSTHIAVAQKLPPTTSQRIKYIDAAENFEKTADVAPTSERKFDALILVGENYANAHEFEKAFAAYEKASAITPLSSTRLAKLRLGLANATFERDYAKFSDAAVAQKARELYQAYLKTPDIEWHPRDEAHRRIASIWNAQGDAASAALELDKIGTLIHYHGYYKNSDYETALSYLRNAKTKKPSAAVSALIDRIYLELVQAEQDDVGKTLKREQWGELQLAYGAPTRAYAAWATLADDPKIGFYSRAQGIQKIAAQRIKEKQPAQGLKAWERTAKWPAPKASEANWMRLRAQSRAELHEALGNETAVRTELSTIPKMTGMDAFEIWLARYSIAKSHQREMAMLQKTKPSTQVTAQQLQARALQHEKAALTIFENIINTKYADSGTRFYAAMRFVEMQFAKKEYDTALRPVLQLTNEWTKSADIFDDIYLLDLAKAAAHVYVAQNKYRDAVAALDTALKASKQTDAKAHDAKAHEMMRNYFYAALGKNDWKQGREILPSLRGILPAATYDVEALFIEVNSENWPAAATALLNLEGANHSYNQQITDLIAQAKARIPADALEKARSEKKPIEN